MTTSPRPLWLALVLLLGILATALPALSAELPLAVTPSVANPGQTVTATGTGFQPGARGLVWGGGPYVKASVSLGSNVSASDASVAGGYAYVTTYSTGLKVVDISIPEAPAIVGTVDTPGSASGVFVANGYAYVADGTSGLQVIDISMPTAPVIVGNVGTQGSAARVSAANGYAYVTAQSGSLRQASYLQVIDITTPTSPAIVGSVAIPRSAPFDVSIGNGYAFVAANSGLYVIDIRNPRAAVMVGSVDSVLDPWFASNAVSVANGYAYLLGTYGDLTVIDIGTPEAPEVVGGYRSDKWLTDITIANGYAYVASSDGFLILDVTVPSAPVAVGSGSADLGGRIATVAEGNAYVLGDHLQIIDVSTPENSGTEVS